MKGWKRIVVILCAVLAVASLAACGLGDSTENVSAPLSLADEETASIVESSEAETETQPLPPESEQAEVTEEIPTVYMTTDISQEGLMAIYERIMDIRRLPMWISWMQMVLSAFR